MEEKHRVEEKESNEGTEKGLATLGRIMDYLQEAALMAGPMPWLDPEGEKIRVRVPCPKEMQEILGKVDLVPPKLTEGFYHLLIIEGLTKVAEKIRRKEEAGDEK